MRLVTKTIRTRRQYPATIECVQHDAPSRLHMKALENIELLPCSNCGQFGAPASARTDWIGSVPFAARSLCGPATKSRSQIMTAMVNKYAWKAEGSTTSSCESG